jgi:hypothetical protein
MHIRALRTIMLLAVFLVACGNAPGPQPTQSPLSPLASPLPNQPGKPSQPAPSSAVRPFQFERPLVVGATEIRGTGPAGVPVYIADVTFMGDPLGTGTIGPDGKFAIQVHPLETGHRIGLALGVLEGTPWKPEDFYPEKFFGPGAMQVPQVGFFHDTEMVSAK